MSGNIPVTGRVEQSVQPSPSARPNSVQVGSFQGERVAQVETPAAKLADAAEEMSMFHSEQTERKLSKREIKSVGAHSVAAEIARKYLEQVPGLQQSDMQEFAKQALARKGADAEPRALRQSAKQFFRDPTYQYTALSYARDLAQAEGNEDMARALDEACQQLRQEEPAAVQAGLNVSKVAHSYSERGLDDTENLLGLYRDVVLDYGTVVQAYDQIVQQHSEKQFPQAVNFILKSLAVDLGAESQSLPKTQLKQIVDDMDKLKSLSTMYEQCGDLLQRVSKNYDTVSGEATADDLMKGLLDVQDKVWQGGDAFTDLLGQMGISDTQPAIYFMQGFKEVVRLMPVKAFDNDAVKRTRVMQGVQEALDNLIDNEEVDV
ncbi:MAG: type III secretion system gatekeeper subunit SctW [Gammaproteobacteria bacterium]